MSGTIPAGASLPLVLSISRAEAGPIAGAGPTVAVRRADAGDYLDWTDGAFRSSGWALRRAPMVEVDPVLSPGRYQRNLSLHAVPAAVPGTVLVAEYEVSIAGVASVATESWMVMGTDLAIDRVRKWFTNRLEEAAGGPGTLVLYDDDDVSPLLTWQVRDGLGGPTVYVPGRPARRSRGV